MTKGNKNKGRNAGNSRDEVERKRDNRARKSALKKEREAKEYLENDENFVSFSNQLQASGYKIKDIKGDGNCLFRALADQLEGDDSGHLRLRRITAKYVADHREQFEPFVEDNKSFDDHVKQLSKPGTYGGNDSIVAFSRHHGVDIVIHQLNERCWVIQGQHYSTSKHEDPKELHISYHNGDHYSSVRRLGDPDNEPAWVFNTKHKENDVSLQSKSRGQNPRKKPSTENDTTACCKGDLHPESSDYIAVVRAATGCQDTQLIQQTFCESGNDINVTISYILQIQTVMAEPDDGKCSPSELSNIQVVDGTNIDMDGECQDEDTKDLKLTISGDSSVEKNSQQTEREFYGARPKVKQTLTSKKRKQLAKQEKKTRRMEERREEAKQKQDLENLDEHRTNETLPILADIDALSI